MDEMHECCECFCEIVKMMLVMICSTLRMGDGHILNVWKDNLHVEMRRISQLVRRYRYVGMDTEFPGVVAKPVANFKSLSSFVYQQLRCNVDILKIIQIGISLSDEQGNRPQPTNTWQFNFEFNLETEMYSQESIDLLIQARIDFKEHKRRGIRVEEFGEALMTSGLVLNEDVTWISFHSAFDFGYLVKILTCNMLPEREDLLKIFALGMCLYFNQLFYIIGNSSFNCAR